MSTRPVPILVMMAIAAALFFAGRWTAPPPASNYQRVMDSLTRLQEISDSIRIQAERREQYYKDQYFQSYLDGMKAQKDKEASKKKHEQDTTLNHRRTPDQRDSVLWSRYAKRL